MTDWVKHAACRDLPPDLFFPGTRDGVPQTPSQMEETKKQAFKVCAVCPVRRQCYELGVRNRERHGIWGGVTFGAHVRSTCGTIAGHRAHTRNGETACADCDTARRLYDQDAYSERRKQQRQEQQGTAA